MSNLLYMEGAYIAKKQCFSGAVQPPTDITYIRTPTVFLRDSPMYNSEAVKVRQAGHDLNGQLPAEGCVARHRQVSEGLPNTSKHRQVRDCETPAD